MAGLRGDRAFTFPFDIQALIDEIAERYGKNPEIDRLLHEILEPMLVDRDRAIEDAVSGVMARPAAPGFDAIVDPDLGAEIPHLRLFKTVRSALAHLKGAGWPTNKTVRIGMRGRWDSSEVTETGNISDTPAGVTVVGLGRAVRWNLGSSLIQSGSWTIENLNVFVSSATGSQVFGTSVPAVVLVDAYVDAPASTTTTRLLSSTTLIAENSTIAFLRFTGTAIVLNDTHLEFDQRTSGTITLGTSGTGPSSTTYLIMRGGSIGTTGNPANPISVLSRLAVFDGFYTVSIITAPGGQVRLNAAGAQTQRMFVRPAISAFSVFGSGVEVTATNSNADVFVDGAGVIAAPGLDNGYVKTWDETLDAAVWTDPNGAFAPAAHGSTHNPGGTDAVTTGTPGNITPGDTAAEGTATSLARSDHKHGAPAFGTTAGTIAEGDHTHALDDLDDVDTSGASDGDALVYDADNDEWVPGTSSGGVSGPGSSTDDRVARWDGTSGTALNDSDVRLTDSGQLGIGVDPSAKLHVAAGSGSATTAIIDGGTTDPIPLDVRGEGTANAMKFRVINTGATSTARSARFSLDANTTAQARSMLEFRAQWSDNTDASRTALVTWSAASSGSFTDFMVIKGTDIHFGGTDPEGVRARITAGAEGAEVTRVESPGSSTTDKISLRQFQYDQTTTNATLTNIAHLDLGNLTSLASTTDLVATFIALVTARRTNGSGEGAGYIVNGAVKVVAGTASLIGAPTILAYENDATWDCQVAVSGDALRINIRGAASQNVDWHATVQLCPLST